MADERKKQLVYAINKFFREQLRDGSLTGESAEGVEVVIQCLETAYNIGPNEPTLDVPAGILEVFERYIAELLKEPKEATEEEKASAEALKTEGNAHMNTSDYHMAIVCYTKAIRLNPKNAVYYCNRAAASNKLANYESAIKDCKTAIQLDPTYSKAYGRLGLAHASLNQHSEAVRYYRMAVELEPENESYLSNLRLAEDSLRSAPSASTAAPAAGASAGAAAGASAGASTAPPQPIQGIDLSALFNNPNLLNMASQMLTNPNMQNVMSNILAGGGGNPNAQGMDALLQAFENLRIPPGAQGELPEEIDVIMVWVMQSLVNILRAIDDQTFALLHHNLYVQSILLVMSQQLAAQMESDNPVLIEQLRRHLSGGGDHGGFPGAEGPAGGQPDA